MEDQAPDQDHTHHLSVWRAQRRGPRLHTAEADRRVCRSEGDQGGPKKARGDASVPGQPQAIGRSHTDQGHPAAMGQPVADVDKLQLSRLASV